MQVVKVNVASIRPKYQNLHEWCCNTEQNEYIGRRGVVFIDGARYPPQSSIWCNPFKITKTVSRDKCIEQYREYITKKLETDKKLKDALLQLKGKTLGCWCAPEKCHGDVLIKLIEKMDQT